MFWVKLTPPCAGFVYGTIKAMETVNLITLYLPRPNGPPRVQVEIYAVRVLTDTTAAKVHYTDLNGVNGTLIVSGDMFLKIESWEKGEAG